MPSRIGLRVDCDPSRLIPEHELDLALGPEPISACGPMRAVAGDRSVIGIYPGGVT